MKQIKINNKIKETKCKLYHEGKLVGVCKNELAVLDVRLQIKQKRLTGYYFVFGDKERISIDSSGSLDHFPEGFCNERTALLAQLVRNRRTDEDK